MRKIARGFVIVGFCVAVVAPTVSWAKSCPRDSVPVGDACVDKYEASVWSTTDAATVKRIRAGRVASATDLGAATQHGAASDDYGAGCPDNAAGCTDYYAVSVLGVTPSAFINWFQAAAACRNSGKRLATNQEWTMAAFGTPDPGTDNGTTDCNISNTLAVTTTGARTNCVSDTGVFDMVGNLYEWVADWAPFSMGCPGWGSFSNDGMCFSGVNTNIAGPTALIRGGAFDFGNTAGVFAVSGSGVPYDALYYIGFRCALRHP